MSAKRTVDWELLRERTKLASAADPSATDLTAIFAERAMALARVGGERTDAARSTLLCFSHSERTFAVGLSSVARVLRARKLTRIPRAPRHLDRVFQESGRIVAALDASALFGAPVVADGSEAIVLLQAGESWLGVRATRVFGTRAFAMEQLVPPAGDLAGEVARCVRGIARDLTIVLDGSELVRSLRSHKEGQ